MATSPLNVSQYAVAHRFSAPEGIAADAAGTLYVTEARGRGDVWRIRPDGVDAVANLAAFVANAGKAITLLGIAVHESGKLFVAAPDIERGSIMEIPREGNRFGAPRIFRNRLGFANGIAIHGDTIFASDAGSPILAGTVPGRVYRFDVSGAAPRGGPPRPGETLARVNFPNGLAISPDGRTLFVAQTSKLQILPGHTSRLHLDAGRLRFEKGPALGGWPDGLALDATRSRLLVCLQKAGAIAVSDFQGRIRASYRLEDDGKQVNPASICLLPDGDTVAFTDIWTPNRALLILRKEERHERVFKIPAHLLA